MISKDLEIPVEKNYEIDGDIANKFGLILLRKGIIDSKILVKAVAAKRNENINSNENGKPKRNLAQILVEDFKYDHDIIFKEVAKLYAFSTYEFNPDEDNTEKIEKIKKLINSYSDDLKKQMVIYKVIPVQFDEKIKDKIILAAVDP
ncbi:MAG TPA: hypothetical protein VLM39_04410, partial [Ignavibacteriaceae bacterium]|nr:hypothetical protein [Ignavibacteriaceae bacterium]